MQKQRNLSEVKEQDKPIARVLSKRDINHMPGGEFKTTIVKYTFYV